MKRDRFGKPHWLVSVGVPALVSGIIVATAGFTVLSWVPEKYLLFLAALCFAVAVLWRPPDDP